PFTQRDQLLGSPLVRCAWYSVHNRKWPEHRIAKIRIKFHANARKRLKRSFPSKVHDAWNMRRTEVRVHRGCDMGFLIKSAFWLSLVLLVIPFGNDADGQPTVGAVQAFLAARAVVDDLSGLCERRPDVCEVGRAAMHTI